MRIRLTLLIGLFGLTLNGCKTAEQEATTALKKACGTLINKMQPTALIIPQPNLSSTSAIVEADQGPRNIWEAAESARTW